MPGCQYISSVLWCWCVLITRQVPSVFLIISLITTFPVSPFDTNTHTHKLRPHIHNKTDIMVETFVQWKVRNTHTHKVFHLKCCEIEALSSLEHLQRGLQNKHLFSPCLGRTISREKIGILTVMSFPSITACVVSYCEGVGEKQLLQTLNQHLYSNVFKLQWGAQRKLIKNEIIAI